MLQSKNLIYPPSHLSLWECVDAAPPSLGIKPLSAGCPHLLLTVHILFLLELLYMRFFFPLMIAVGVTCCSPSGIHPSVCE